MNTSFCCGLTCYGLVSYPGGVTNYRPLNKQETEISASPVRRLAGEGFSLASQEIFSAKPALVSCSNVLLVGDWDL